MTTISKWWSSSAVLVYDLHRGMCCKPSGKVQEGRASDGDYMRLVMVLTPLQPTTVVRKSPGIEQ